MTKAPFPSFLAKLAMTLTFFSLYPFSLIALSLVPWFLFAFHMSKSILLLYHYGVVPCES